MRTHRPALGVLLGAGLILGLANAHTTWAYFMDLGGGVRPTGMGEAFVAVADDVNAMQYNPAGLASVARVEFAGMYSDLYSQLHLRLYNQAQERMGYNLLAAAVPVPGVEGAAGLTWKQFDSVFYQENLLMLGYGRDLWTWGRTPGEGGALALGGNLKWLQWRLEPNQFTLDLNQYPYSELQKNAFSADLGLLCRLGSNWSAGVSVENLVPADLGMTTVENVPAVYRLGAAYSLGLKSTLADSLLATVEVSDRDQVLGPKVGLESWHFDQRVALRAGANSEDLSLGLSYRYALDLAWVLQVDYAFTYPWYLSDTLGSHWIGLTVSWDRRPALQAERAKALARKTEAALAAKMVVLEAAQAASQSLAEAQQAARTGGAEAFDRISDAGAKIGSAGQAAKPALETVQTIARELKSNTLTAVAAEAVQAETAIQSATEQVLLLLRAYDPLAATARPRRELPPLPEKYSDRIVIGIEAKLVTDFGSLQDMEPMLQSVAESLQRSIGMPLEWRLLSPAELQLALQQGELDAVAGYETDLGRYRYQGGLEPVLTAQKNGRTDQPCYLIVLAGSPMTTLAQVQGKRLGYSNALIGAQLDRLFFDGVPSLPGRYFKGMEKQKNARDSLLALQMEAVDVVAEYAYILDIARAMPDLKVRIIAGSAPARNVPLLLRPSRYPAKLAALQKLVTTLREFHHDPAGREWLRHFQIDRLVGVNE